MEIVETTLENVYLIRPKVFEDYRGSYRMIWNDHEYCTSIPALLDLTFVEHTVATSIRGVLRGIHWDSKRWKLCQCLYGRLYQVVVEPESGKWVSFILSGENHLQVLIPPRHGNSYQVLSDYAVTLYYMSEYHDPKRERIYPWDSFNIDWPIVPPILSKKDKEAGQNDTTI